MRFECVYWKYDLPDWGWKERVLKFKASSSRKAIQRVRKLSKNRFGPLIRKLRKFDGKQWIIIPLPPNVY